MKFCCGIANFYRRNSQKFSCSLLSILANKYKMPTSSHFTILYGSQTGQAQAIAEEIHENASQNGLQSKLYCLSHTEKKFTLEKEPLVVFIVSTTGEGEPPDTMCKFMRRLKKKTLPNDHLKDCQYALLALGDTNYTNFCNNGKNLDRRLLGLGAKQFYNTGYADDAVGLELTVDPWIEGLWDAIKKCLGLVNENGMGSEEKIRSEEKMESKNMPKICNGTAQNEATNQSHLVTNGNDINEKPLCTTKNFEQNSISDKTENIIQSSKDTDVNICKDLKNNSQVRDRTADEGKEKEDTLDTDTNPQQPSLRVPSEHLSSSSLSIPLLSPRYLKIEFNTTAERIPHENVSCYDDNKYSKASILSAKTLTSKGAIKTALEIELDITDCGLDYQPGDSFDILCPNNEEEVDELIQRLGLRDKRDIPFSLSIMEETFKKVAVKPSYIPEICTVKSAFLNCLEIRSVPKKAMIRMLVEYTDNSLEKRRLQELCSKQGMKEYQTYIREPSASLLEILKAFPSCNPPFERLLEHLPQLNPRPYSIASSPHKDPNKLKFVFNIIEFQPYENLRSNRKGVCTGWLSNITNIIRNEGAVEDELAQLQINDESKPHHVLVAPRKHNKFRLPDDTKIPIVMVGPGTGVAPFIGFLERRMYECIERNPSEVYGKSFLFYGCRNRNLDYLYQEQLLAHCSSGILSNLLVSFSREEGSTVRYVQDNLRLHSKEVAKMVFDEGGIIYVCGDAKNMSKDVFAVFCEIAEQHFGISKADAIQEIGKLRANNQYHEDVWT